MTLGLGLPNAQYRVYSDAECAAVLDLKPHDLLILGYPQSPVLQSKIGQEASLFQQLGWPRIILRPYADGIITFQPAEWALQCSELLRKYLAAGMGPVEMIPGNEFNIEQGGENWGSHISWLKAFATMFRQLAPPTVLHLPALSPTGNYRKGDSAYRAAGLYNIFDRHDHHVYSERDFPSGDARACITEWNQIPAEMMARSGFENYYFILNSDDPDFQRYSLIRNPGLYADMARAMRIENGGETMPEYVFGVKAEVERLAAVGANVGEPLENEYWFTPELAVQTTTKGQFWIRKLAPNLFDIQYHPKA